MSKAILYATSMGKNTEAVAKYMAKQMNCDLFDLKKLSKLDLTAYDTIVFGTGVHAGKPYAPVTDFIANNKDVLAKKKVHLFIHCMYNEEKGQKQCDKIAEQYGIQHAVFFNKSMPEMNEAGFPKAVDDFIASL